MKRILVVTDFSPTANVAVPYAYALVEPGGEVHLVHVIEHSVQPNPMYAHYSPDSLALPQERERVMAEVEQHLLSLVPKGAKKKAVTTVVGCVLHPDIPAGVIEEARERKVDAVVMGSHGRTGVRHLLMGSVAEQVLRGSGLPVLIIPHQG